jgi:uncharacterized repeat protein (TIGR01451 family)
VWHQEMYIGGAHGIGICPAVGGGFMVLLKDYEDTEGKKNAVIKFDEAGQMVWLTAVGNLPYLPNGLNDIIKTSDGAYLLAGETRNTEWEQCTWLVRLNEAGTEVWRKTIPSTIRVHDILELPTGAFFLQGIKHLTKVGPDGSVIWTKEYNVTNFHELRYSLGGQILMMGERPTPNQANLDLVLQKVDWDGNQSWTRTQQVNDDNLPLLLSFAQNSSGEIFVPVYSDETTSLYKFNEDGFLMGQVFLGGSVIAYQTISTADNSLCLFGSNLESPLIMKTDVLNSTTLTIVSGHFFKDLDGDCVEDAGEQPFKDVIVKAKDLGTGFTYYKVPDANGDYAISLPGGTFEINANPIYGPASFYGACPPLAVNVPNTPSPVVNVPSTGIKVLEECPLVEVELSAGLLRRCTTTYYTVNYCNVGNETATDVTVKLALDPLLSYSSSSIPLAGQSGNELIFSLSNLPPGECGNFKVLLLVSCSAAVGDVICLEAMVSQSLSCLLGNPGADGSKIVATGTCNNNGVVFTLQNIGTEGTQETLQYVIIEDQIMLAPVPFSLPAGGSIQVQHPTTLEDSCLAIRILPNASATLSKPIAVVENCNNPSGNQNLLLQLPNNENDPQVSVHCDAVIGSFDPNDKTGFPLGITDKHFIKRGDALEYRIRFQNTGNDTAFTVVIEDLLALALDAGTVRPLGASHSYTWEITDGRLLRFRFANILLPDSTTNEPASHGYVMFRVQPDSSLSDGAAVVNQASIFFDFNPPIFTNTSLHTIGSFPSGTQVLHPALRQVSVLPNPHNGRARIALEGELPNQTLHLTLTDGLGRTHLEADFTGKVYDLDMALAPGVYFFQIRDAAGLPLAVGRTVAQ